MMKEKEAEDEEPFKDFKYEKVALMCYTSRDIIMIMTEWGDGWWWGFFPPLNLPR